ncbi:WD40/YVTN/BNR-like repeat-containing protein [Zhihengliuella halotolerans]|uniref:BNR/Asp-box repeat protein n=1 Tax=Zhihengliuella halotolerans TaxID=370736 RepID=A0A4Q8AFL6_9MICC|nr:sialidase family protein [Zhihengliuella halotolerans]RZU63110.1 BNR/Asp-box repeat protein [Zhihengliuella halotolerans]
MSAPETAAADTMVLLAIGTKKGLWLAASEDREHWTLSDPHFLILEASSVAIDTRNGAPRVLAGLLDWHWGPTVVTSDDLGATWTDPEQGAIKFPPDTGAALERVWHLRPDAASRPGIVWAGAEPHSLWRSEDGGETFKLNRGLWDHPQRASWEPGGGGPCLHTVDPDPDSEQIHIAASAAGVYRSDDGGATWEPANRGIAAGFLPGEEPEYGQCVHRIARDAEQPGRLYAQNHGGVYRSDDAGGTWVSIADGLPGDFGFTFLTHPRIGGTGWVIPMAADIDRIPAGARVSVYKTEDGGDTWTENHAGLPDKDFNTILRDASAVDDHPESTGVYFGTRAGEVFASADEGATFTRVAHRLPDVLSVRAAVVPKTALPQGSAKYVPQFPEE